MKKVYLLTGKPGTGKTSLIKQTIATIKGKAGGFYTEEIKDQGVRQGFKLVTLRGQEAIMAHVNIHSRYRVGKYGVDIESFERVGISELQIAAEECDVIVIDEIGKMELYSPRFGETVWQIIKSGKKILGTIMLNSHPWVDEIKSYPNVNIITVTRDNNERILEEIKGWLETSGD